MAVFSSTCDHLCVLWVGSWCFLNWECWGITQDLHALSHMNMHVIFFMPFCFNILNALWWPLWSQQSTGHMPSYTCMWYLDTQTTVTAIVVGSKSVCIAAADRAKSSLRHLSYSLGPCCILKELGCFLFTSSCGFWANNTSYAFGDTCLSRINQIGKRGVAVCPQPLP